MHISFVYFAKVTL